MLQRLYKGQCKVAGQGEGLFQCLESPASTISAEDYSLEEVRELYESKFGPLPWLQGYQFRKLHNMIYYGLRFNSENTYQNTSQSNNPNLLIALCVLNQALVQGIGVVMGKLTPEAEQFYCRARQVFAECHRVKGFIRFSPLKGNSKVLVGRAEFQHNIADMVLKHFRQRYPEEKVIILRGDKALYLEGTKVIQKDREKMRLNFDEKEFDDFWSTFYDSQVIENRLNKKLAKKHIPKKLWSWVPEGHKLR